MPAEGAAATPPHPREILRRHGLRPHRARGQNFLVAARDLDRVVEAARLDARDVVLEIGTGLSRLTERLAARAAQVVTVEVDSGLASVASDRLCGVANVTLLCCDFLAGKHAVSPPVSDAVRDALAGGEAPLKVVSNLPYSISSPAIVNLLEWELPVGEMCLMVQKEVADRLTAEPGTRDYGPLTVCVDYWATVEKLFSLRRGAFWPPPEVTSTLVRIVRRPGQRRTAHYDAFTATVGRLFSARRKTLANALRAGWHPETADRVLEGLRLDGRMRPGELSTAQFEAIAEAAGPPRAA
ncbi:MAG: hypothetical protein AMK73_05540 [Planctomycetes bacterium SM23_32]|nr:MAG: hypothetical protein AMK73_05540 [Planctomycetes bacterium SM23_32]